MRTRLVDGDPTRDISATERISTVVLKGERVRRVDLFDAARIRGSEVVGPGLTARLYVRNLR
jgi:hypothetical protein